MTLTLPPSPPPMRLPDTIKRATVETTSYRNDNTRVDVDGNSRVGVDGSRRIGWGNYTIYAQIMGQVPNMSRRMSLPE
jgi:hypothetical protein